MSNDVPEEVLKHAMVYGEVYMVDGKIIDPKDSFKDEKDFIIEAADVLAKAAKVFIAHRGYLIAENPRNAVELGLIKDDLEMTLAAYEKVREMKC